MNQVLSLDYAIQRKLEGIKPIVFDDIINHVELLSKISSSGFKATIPVSVIVRSPHDTVPVHSKEQYSPSEIKTADI